MLPCSYFKISYVCKPWFTGFSMHCLTFAFPLQLVYIFNSSGQLLLWGSLLQGCFWYQAVIKLPLKWHKHQLLLDSLKESALFHSNISDCPFAFFSITSKQRDLLLIVQSNSILVVIHISPPAYRCIGWGENEKAKKQLQKFFEKKVLVMVFRIK